MEGMSGFRLVCDFSCLSALKHNLAQSTGLCISFLRLSSLYKMISGRTFVFTVEAVTRRLVMAVHIWQKSVLRL